MIFWRALLLAQAADQSSSAEPARIAARYVLTSCAQSEAHDPSAWRLLGSNDRGETWTTLDVKTNQSFAGRSQRIIFLIKNQQAFNTYRLQIDAVNSTNVSIDMSVQLAGFSIVGPLVNVPNESKLQSIISSSCANPVIGPPEYAFDDDPSTAWCDLGWNSPGGSWLQIRYALSSEILVTNLGQASQWMHVRAARATLADGGARVLSNLTSMAVAPRKLTAYALTSANDSPERDPRDWELLGSNDDGKTWSVLDSRVNQIFTERFERRVFTLADAVPCRIYRLQLNACAASNSSCQIAEIEPLYADPQNDAKYSLVVGANSDNPPLESTEMAFDSDSRTKWYSSVPVYTNQPCWVQWQLTPREEDLPVINQRQIDRLANALVTSKLLGETNCPKVRITGYALTSANDFPGRDPSDWTLLGSNDSGQTWQTLDDRRHELFSDRFQRRVFPLPHPAAFQTFRLRINSVATPTNVNSVQLAKLDPIFEHPSDAASLTVLVSSEGENPPVESVDNLFDGDLKTKWLDYSPASSNHSSWIEWRYVGGPKRHAIDIDREQVTQSLSPKRMRVRLPATVLFANPSEGLAGLGDQTGFQWMHLDAWPGGLAPGVQMIVSGDLQIKGGALFLSHAQAESVRPLPIAGNAAPSATSKPSYLSGSVTGRVVGSFSAPSYCGATLALSNGSSIVVRLPGARFPVPPGLGCPVKVDGVIESLLSNAAAFVPAVIWAPGPEAITLDPVTDEDWNNLTGSAASIRLTPSAQARGRGDTNAASQLLTTISDVRHYLNRGSSNDAPVKIQGVVTYIDLDLGEFYLQDGPDCVQVIGQMNAGLAPKLSEEGSYVELRGVVHESALFATAFAHILGQGRMPDPARPSWDNLMTGEDDGRWVEIEGVITATERQRLALSVTGGQLIAWINELDKNAARSLLGNVARIRGVCSPVVNSRNQRLGVRLLVPSFECVDLVNIAPENPFDLPLLPLEAVMRANSETIGKANQCVKSKGLVTCRQGRLLFLQDGLNGMRVTLRDDAAVAVGDVIEAVGRPQPDGFSPKLIQAVVRKIGQAKVPNPTPIDLIDTTSEDSAQQRDATRATMDGILLSETVDTAHWTLNLRNEQAQQVFCAYLPAGDSGARASIPVGARIRIQGVFKAIRDKAPDVDQAATSFEMYLNSPDDIVVLERPSWWTSQHTLQLTAVFAGFLAVASAWIWLLRSQVRQRTRALASKIQEHERSESLLAAEVVERKRLQVEADKAHQELLVVARQAGMAEVATGILHNVGNVLNSVNVSSSIVIDRLRQSKVDGLDKAVALLHQNENELGAFFKTHEKGRKLLKYLKELAGHLASDQAIALKELDGLDKNITHIKDIVATQQSSAKFAGLTERLQLIDLVEDALRMNASALERHDVQIARDFDPATPSVEADRHKILQILINLITNAKYACDEAARPDKHITIGVRNGGATIKVSVSDNGVGILPENLDRVFNHGFTTRKTGHGFGLHNSALAAREMGGSLRAASDGPGRGATFILELPCGHKTKPAAS